MSLRVQRPSCPGLVSTKSWSAARRSRTQWLPQAGNRMKHACEGHSSGKWIVGRNKVAQLPDECAEFRDAVSADGVDSECIKSFPLHGFVGRPRDHSRSDRMSAVDRLFVDRVHFLPQIVRGGSEERRGRIDVTGGLQNTRPDCRQNGLNVLDDTVVE